MKSIKDYSSITFFIALFLMIPILAYSQQKNAKNATEKHIKVYKKPGCMCCDKWVSYLKENGFSAELIRTDTLATIKKQNGLTKDLRSCHTGFIDGYVVEGHVPVESINKMLTNKPDAIGITVPGMPTGTPGMGLDGTPYKVLLFDESGEKSVYGEY